MLVEIPAIHVEVTESHMIFRRKGVLELQGASRRATEGGVGGGGKPDEERGFKEVVRVSGFERSVYVEVSRVSKDDGR